MVEQSEDEYSFEENLLGFYKDILDARRETAKALRALRNIQNSHSDDLEKSEKNKNQAENNFYNYLDHYYDLMENKWNKSSIDKPKAVKKAEKEEEYCELFKVSSLHVNEAIVLYKRLNAMAEDLEITSLENLQFERRKV